MDSGVVADLLKLLDEKESLEKQLKMVNATLQNLRENLCLVMMADQVKSFEDGAFGVKIFTKIDLKASVTDRDTLRRFCKSKTTQMGEETVSYYDLLFTEMVHPQTLVKMLKAVWAKGETLPAVSTYYKFSLLKRRVKQNDSE
jgi:hypothetical protein